MLAGAVIETNIQLRALRLTACQLLLKFHVIYVFMDDSVMHRFLHKVINWKKSSARFSITNLKYWGGSEAIISRTLQLLNDLSVGYSSVRKLVKLDAVQFMLDNHRVRVQLQCVNFFKINFFVTFLFVLVVHWSEVALLDSADMRLHLKSTNLVVSSVSVLMQSFPQMTIYFSKCCIITCC